MCCMILSGYERHKGHNASFFDCIGQNSLMFSAGAMALWRINLPLGIHKAPQKISVLKINLADFVLAEIALFFFLLNFIHCHET